MKIKLTVIFIIIVVSLSVFFYTKSSSQSISRYFIVKLYSGEKVIGTWRSIELGRIDGQTLTFTVKGDFDTEARQVRIQGNYTVEEFR